MRVVMGVEMSDEPFLSFSFDGVLGLGLSALSLTSEFNFFQSMVSHGQIRAPQFAIFLANNHNEVSEISFGGYKEEHLHGGLHWVSVASPEVGYWQVSVKAVRVGGKALDFCGSGDCHAVLDTGTSHFGVPGPILQKLKNSMSSLYSGSHSSTDCRNATGPNVEIDLGKFSLTLGPQDYAKPRPFLAGGKKGDVSCRPNLLRVSLPPPLGPNLFVLGEPVLRRYYTVFDWNKKMVGFGEALHDDDEKVLDV
jgi:hypothetical protein